MNLNRQNIQKFMTCSETKWQRCSKIRLMCRNETKFIKYSKMSNKVRKWEQNGESVQKLT